jgi:hypothetical protein
MFIPERRLWRNRAVRNSGSQTFDTGQPLTDAVLANEFLSIVSKTERSAAQPSFKALPKSAHLVQHIMAAESADDSPYPQHIDRATPTAGQWERLRPHLRTIANFLLGQTR